jgi:formate dehydrogenase maturation protein FdhE
MAQIKKEKPAYRSLLDFYEKIYIEKYWCYKSLKPRFSDPDENYIHLKIKGGFPILDKNAVQFNIEALEEFFQKLLLLSQEKSPDTATKLAKYIQQGNLDVRKMIIELWEGRLNICNYEKEDIGDPTLLYFLLIECIKPVYEYFAQKLKGFIKEELWKRGYCPICGESPPIAEISTEKREKLLFCIQCGTDWHFP